MHEVLQNQTKYAIAKQYGISITAIDKANPTVEKGSLKIGQKINIPVKEGTKANFLAENESAISFDVPAISIKETSKAELVVATPSKEAVSEISKDSVQTYLETKNFDTIINGKKVNLYWIENKGIKAAFTNYGGRLIGLWVADKNGKQTDVVVGMNSVKGFKNSTEPYFGATIGRVGNRVALGKFTLEGKQYQIPLNNGKNALHGGVKGFQDVVWNAEKPNENTIVFTYISLFLTFPSSLRLISFN